MGFDHHQLSDEMDFADLYQQCLTSSRGDTAASRKLFRQWCKAVRTSAKQGLPPQKTSFSLSYLPSKFFLRSISTARYRAKCQQFAVDYKIKLKVQDCEHDEGYLCDLYEQCRARADRVREQSKTEKAKKDAARDRALLKKWRKALTKATKRNQTLEQVQLCCASRVSEEFLESISTERFSALQKVDSKYNMWKLENELVYIVYLRPVQ
jgi:hypothetical protein